MQAGEYGRALAPTLTFQSQVGGAAEIIEQHWDRDDAFYRPKARISPDEG
ncbi:hypothetical protein [Rhizobium sp. SL42]|nr:hypothetical protein [Rhizobium sp. SL42]UJW76396.1 hypothetical protein IM739_07925 [Rhizobium sp. SL42]